MKLYTSLINVHLEDFYIYDLDTFVWFFTSGLTYVSIEVIYQLKYNFTLLSSLLVF